jgi:hypothetical protein
LASNAHFLDPDQIFMAESCQAGFSLRRRWSMAISVLERVASLRESAAHCRELAQTAIPFEVGLEIERFANDLDAEAAKLEQSALAAPPAAPKKPRSKETRGAASDPRRTARRSVGAV